MAKTAFAIASTSVILPPIRGIVISTGLPYTGGNSGTSGLSIKYTRQGAAPVTIAPAAQTPGGGFVSGGFCHTDAGDYRLDPPNAAFVAGVQWVAFTISGVTDVIFDDMFVDLTGTDPRAAVTDAVDVTRIDGATIAGGAKMPSQVKGMDNNVLTNSAIATGAISDTKLASDTITGANLATSAVAEIQGGIPTQVRDALLNWAPISGVSLAKILRAVARFFTSSTTGRESGTETYVDAVDGENIVVQYDGNGNRISVDISAVSSTP